MLGVVGFTEPQQRKLGNALLPKKISQRLRCPCIAIGRLRRRRKCSEHSYNLSDGLGRNRFAGEYILSGPSICMSIQQEADGFGGGDRRFPAAVVDKFGNRENSDVLPTAQLIGLPHDVGAFRVDRFLVINLWAIIVVRQEAAVIRLNAGRDSGAINDRGAW